MNATTLRLRVLQGLQIARVGCAVGVQVLIGMGNALNEAETAMQQGLGTPDVGAADLYRATMQPDRGEFGDQSPGLD